MPNKPITDEKLAAWRALREAATAGEWHGGYLGSGPNQPYTDPATLIFKVGTMIIDSIEAQGEERPFMSVLADKRTVAMTLHGPTNFANTDFIVAAGNNWLRLLDEITRLRAECDRLRAILREQSPPPCACGDRRDPETCPDRDAECDTAFKRERDRLRALARELREAMDDMVSIANDSSGITGWHMNGDVLHWQQCEPLAVMEDLLARPDVKELEG